MRIVVVGGGSSASFFLESLLERGGARLAGQGHSLTILSAEASPGNRRAFGIGLPPELILNTPNWELDSLIPGWLEYRLEAARKDEHYSARALFGEFLSERWTKIVTALKDVFDLTVKRAKVSSISYSNSQYLLTTNDATIPADVVVLCIGSSSDKERENELHGARVPYLIDAYSQELSDVPQGASVGIVGSRLTAVDAILRLHAHGHVGPIVVASKSGRLPRVRPAERVIAPVPSVPWLEFPSSKRNLSLSASWKLARRTLNEPASELRKLLDSEPTTPESWEREVTEARTFERRSWQRKAYQATGMMEDLWEHLSERAQIAFLTMFRSVFIGNIVGIPFQSAETLLTLMKRGQLSVRAGFAGIDRLGNGRAHRLRFSDASKMDVAFAVDATSRASTNHLDPVVSSLCRSGLARREPNGAIAVNRFSCQVNAPVPTHGLMFCVGDLSLGRNFVSSSLETNRRQAKRASVAVFRSLLNQEVLKVTVSMA